jgi:hypothetical protein
MIDEYQTQNSDQNIGVVTLAKQVFTNKYRKRPKSSLRMSIAQFKFPSAMAAVHFSPYEKCPDAAKAIPAAFKATTKVKSFLASKDRKDSQKRKPDET